MQDRLCDCGCNLNPSSSSRSCDSQSGLPLLRSDRITASLLRRSPPSYHRLTRNGSSRRPIARTEPTTASTSSVRPESTCGMTSVRCLRPSFSSALFTVLSIILLAMLPIAHAQSSPSPSPSATPEPTPAPWDKALMTAAQTPQDHHVEVDITQPVVCETMNITFDPSRGTPPYSLMIAIEDWWPIVVKLPQDYDDASKSLWLYQFPVPTFRGATTNPHIIVSITDSTAQMSNSSAIVQVQNSTDAASCPSYAGAGDFIFYTEKAASQCQDYDIFWRGNYTAPVELVFLPESAPPIYVPAPVSTSGNMSWTVAMTGGTRFLLTMGDAGVKTGGVSKLNIVALNEYFSDTCISQNTYAHSILPVHSTASPATIFPDATSTIASLTTSNGVVATVTVLQTIRNGRALHPNTNRLSSAALIGLVVATLVGFGLGGVALGWFCYRRRQKKKHNIQSWDLPNDPSVPFNANPNMPIAPNFFGRNISRHDSVTTSEREGTHRPSLSAANSYDPVGLSGAHVTHATSARGSLRSWTSNAFDNLHIATGHPHSHTPSADEYALVGTALNHQADSNNANAHYGSSLSGDLFLRSSRADENDIDAEVWSPNESSARTYDTSLDTPASSDRLHSLRNVHSRSRAASSRAVHGEERRTNTSQLHSRDRSSSPASASRAHHSDASSTKSSLVGAGPTYRPDAASQAAYQDLLTSTSSPPGTLTSQTTSAATAVHRRSHAHLPPSSLSPRGDSNSLGWSGPPDFESREHISGSSTQTSASARIIRHADAGLLMDDTADDGELINLGSEDVMELPPQYDTIHPAGQQTQAPRQHPWNEVTRSPRAPTTGAVNSGDISEQRAEPSEVRAADLVGEVEDESEFWNIGHAS